MKIAPATAELMMSMLVEPAGFTTVNILRTSAGPSPSVLVVFVRIFFRTPLSRNPGCVMIRSTSFRLPALTAASAALLLVALVPCAASGQAVQAVRAQEERAEERALVQARVKALQKNLAAYVALADKVTDRATRSLLSAAIWQTGLTIGAADDPSAFRREWGRLLALNGMLGDAGIKDSELSILGPIPQISTFLPDVVFTLGLESDIPLDGEGVGGRIGLSTNLLGATAGAAFEAIGADPLSDYLKNNIAVGTAFPGFAGSRRPVGQLGLGLGGMNFPKLTVWPVFNMESTNSDDDRLPQDLLSENPDASLWTSPTFSIGIVPLPVDEFISAVRDGKPTVVLNIGIQLPFYYPGDPFSALAAFFTDDRAKYSAHGSARIIVGAAMPILRVKPTKK